MLKRLLRKLYYGILLLKIGGLRASFRQLKLQLYNKDEEIGMKLDLASFCRNGRLHNIDYSLRLATKEDIDKLLQKAKTEIKESTHRLLYRKWFYESGFHNCYVATTADTNELCVILWLISSADEKAVYQNLRGWLPKLEESEILGENAYAFEEYRGSGVFHSVMSDIAEMQRHKGYKRWIVYIKKRNIASLKAHEKLGFEKFEEVPERTVLFCTKKQFGKGLDSTNRMVPKSY